MEKSKYIWLDGEFVDWDSAQVSVMSHTLHYGTGVFEGIRARETKSGTAIFRLQDHVDRLFTSCEAYNLDIPYSKNEIFGVPYLARWGYTIYTTKPVDPIAAALDPPDLTKGYINIESRVQKQTGTLGNPDTDPNFKFKFNKDYYLENVTLKIESDDLLKEKFDIEDCFKSILSLFDDKLIYISSISVS